MTKIAERYIRRYIVEDINKKLVFVDGPRQVGKTTLALTLLPSQSRTDPGYLNWDSSKARQMIRRDELPTEPPLLVLDEIHKFKRWRQVVKGFYDSFYPSRQCLVTGSARLDYYRKGGDSLVGRYHYFRLHPFSLPELGHEDACDALLRYGGFPEPFFSASDRTYRRWSRERVTRVIEEDLASLEQVRDLTQLEILSDLLPPRVGSLLSFNNLAEDLEVSQPTLKRWVDIFTRLYIAFLIPPLVTRSSRAVKKAPKLYLWDWAQVPSEGARFENMVASHLLKFCHFREDTEGFRMKLAYLRDREGRELDFVVLQENKPVFAVECKISDSDSTAHAQYFRERFKIPRVYQVHLGKKDTGSAEKGVRVIPFAKLCGEEQLV